MDEITRSTKPVNPRRRRKTKLEIFKEAYLPVIIVGAALLLILIFIIGSIVRSVENDRQKKKDTELTSQQQSAGHAQLEAEANQLIIQANALANNYQYDEAIAVLDSFRGNPSEFPNLMDARDKIILTKTQLVAWNDPSKVTNLSVRMLIADPNRAFNGTKFVDSFTKNYLTVDEFKMVLDKLYAAGYVLVNMEDVYSFDSSDAVTRYQANTIYLPNGKRPLILTQTNVNYHTYLTNSDADKLPDAGGFGFASKLIFDAAGELTCEYVDSSGQVLTGEYDMIPILNRFVKEHPDFSYQGAKAVIALTGYDGLFGYRTNSEAERFFGTSYYENEIKSAEAVADKLRSDGYELAGYTFGYVKYGNLSVEQVKADITRWTNEVTPILGDVKIFAFAENSDIDKENVLYNTEKLNVLTNAGFSIFLGFCNSGSSWAVSTSNYVRQGRILLTPYNIQDNPDWFQNIFSASQILDPNRGSIPA